MSENIPMAGEIVDVLARAEIAGIKEDVRGVSRDLHSLRDTTATKTDISSIVASISNLTQKHDALRTPQYSLVVSVVGLGMVVLIAIGGFAYWPIRDTQSDLKTAVLKNAELMTTLLTALPKEFASAREVENIRARFTSETKELRDNTVPLREHDKTLRELEKAMPRTEAEKIIAHMNQRSDGLSRRLEYLENNLLKIR